MRIPEAASVLRGFFNLFSTMLYKICIVMMANESDAEDAVQDTFLKYIAVKMRLKRGHVMLKIEMEMQD